MKKQKLKLNNLKVDSFVPNSKKGVVGGANRVTAFPCIFTDRPLCDTIIASACNGFDCA